MSTKELPSVPDNLLLFLSNKILYKENEKFISEHIYLSEIISNARTAYKVPEDTPVTLVSILGSPSNEKFLFMKSLVEYYERGMKDNSLFDGGFEPKTKDLATSGIYLVPKPFLVQQDKKKGLVWILYLFRSDNAAEEDIRLLERFLLLACSRIAEVKFEKEPFPLLQQWSELDGVQHPRCNDFLYVFPSNAYISTEEQGSAMLRSVAEGRHKLYYKMERFRTVQRDTSIIATIPQVSVIEMKTLEKTLYKNLVQAEPEEKAVSHSLKQCIREVHQYFKLGGLKFDKQGRELQLGNLFEFWKECAASALSPLSKNQALARNIASRDECNEEAKGVNVPEQMSKSAGDTDHNGTKTNPKKVKYNHPPQISQQYDNIQEKIAPHVHVGNSPTASRTSHVPQQPAPVMIPTDNEKENANTSPLSLSAEISNAPNSGKGEHSHAATSKVEAIEKSEVGDSRTLHVTESNDVITKQPTNQQGSKENKLHFADPSADSGIESIPEDTKSHNGCQNDIGKVKKGESNSQNDNEERQTQVLTNQSGRRDENYSPKSISCTDTIAPHSDDVRKDNESMPNISATPLEVDPEAVRTPHERKGENEDTTSSAQREEFETPKTGEEVSSDLSDNDPQTMHQAELSDPDNSGNSGSEGNEISAGDPSVTVVEPTPSNTENQDDSNNAKLDNTPTVEGHTQNDNEYALAKTFIPDLAKFYNDEMKRFLAEALYDPATLEKIHENLKTQLTSQFLDILKVDANQMNKLGNELSTLLDNGFPRHSQRNSENWKMKQAKISKCLQKMMSSYMEQIEKVLLDNPIGLENQELESQRDDIVNGVQVRLATEIRGNVREQEPMDRHQDSLMAEIKEYWDCVVERNNQNLEKSQPTGDEGNQAYL